MIKKLVIVLLSAAILSGCTQAKTANSSAIPNNEIPGLVDNLIKEQAGTKQSAEDEAKIKAEQEAKLKAEQEAKEKEEEQSKAKAKAEEAKARQAAKAEIKPSASTASKPSPEKVVPKPAQQASTQNSTSSSALKHPVEYKASIEEEILVLVNQERAKAGVKPLVMNETLRSMARYKSNDMLQHDYFDHTSPNIGGLSNLSKKFNYSYTTIGENIWMAKASSVDYLRQNATAAKIMDGWMNSPGHKANILNPVFGKIGVGVTLSTDGLSHATQEFSN